MNTTDEAAQDLKRAIHYAVVKICEAEGKRSEFKVSKYAMATIAHITQKYVSILGSDLKKFALHARRKTVNDADVLLATRNNASLQIILKRRKDQLRSSSKKSVIKRSKNSNSRNLDDEDNVSPCVSPCISPVTSHSSHTYQKDNRMDTDDSCFDDGGTEQIQNSLGTKFGTDAPSPIDQNYKSSFNVCSEDEEYGHVAKKDCHIDKLNEPQKPDNFENFDFNSGANSNTMLCSSDSESDDAFM